MAGWAKLHSCIAESETYAELHAQDPTAALLWLLLLPQAAPWGILPGSARTFRARVCPLLDLTLEQVESALRALSESGMVQPYQDREGKPLLYVCNWARYQQRQWTRVGNPEHDLPPDWTPVADMTQAASREAWRSGVERRLQSDDSTTALRALSDKSKSTLRPVSDDSESTHRENRRRGEEKTTPVRATSARARAHEDKPPTAIQAACGRLTGSLRPGRTRWSEALTAAANDPNTPLTEDEIVEALEHNGPDQASTPEGWLRHILGLKRRASARASPESSDNGDPDRETVEHYVLEYIAEGNDIAVKAGFNSRYPGQSELWDSVLQEVRQRDGERRAGILG